LTDDHDDDENVPDEALARLDIYSEDMSAEELASFIGQPPDDSWNRGLPAGTKRTPARTTGISYEEETPVTDSPEHQLAKLLERIAPFGDRLADLAQRPGISMQFVVAYFATRGSTLRRYRDPQLRLDAETLATIAKLGVSLKIEVYDN
jgi:Domain of unknown function (DUF4279)